MDVAWKNLINSKTGRRGSETKNGGSRIAPIEENADSNEVRIVTGIGFFKKGSHDQSIVIWEAHSSVTNPELVKV